MTSTAYGGTGGYGRGTGESSGNGGDATAVASGSNSGTGSVSVTANSLGGSGGNGVAGASNGLGGNAYASAFGSGVSGNASSTATAGTSTGYLVNDINANALAPVGSTVSSQAKAQYSGSGFTVLDALGSSSTALAYGAPDGNASLPLMYTNPAGTEIFIQLSEPPSEEMTWTVYDALGRPIWSQDILQDAAFPYRIDAQFFEAGIYYLYAQRAGMRAVGKRFVITR